jgi:CheY-like chemotaxis protein
MTNGNWGLANPHGEAQAAAAPVLGNLVAPVRGTRSSEPKARGEMGSEDLEGMRILVVEDEFFVALVVEETLQSLGCTVLGPFPDLEQATETAVRQAVDGAVLDINLGGEMVYPLAEYLQRHGVPFVFTTGYAIADMPEHFRGFACLRKPVDANTLEQAVRRMLA